MNDWRRSKEYDQWRKAVIKRDGYCTVPGCGATARLEAHHILHAAHWPDLRFKPDNGATRCSARHQQFHTNFKRSSREKCDYVDHLNFECLMKYAKEINARPWIATVPPGEHT